VVVPGHHAARPQAARPGGATTDLLERAAQDDLAPAEVLELQHLAGNEAVAGLVHRAADAHPGRPSLQRKPDESAGDVYEEAEAEARAEAEGPVIVEDGGAAIDAGEGPLAWRAMPADLEGEAMFVLFDDVAVQRLFQHLLRRWGLAGEASENSAADRSPGWVGAFRARALNVRPGADYPGAADEAQLARLAGRLADSVAAESPAQRIRRQFVQEIQGRIGTTVMTQDQINAERSKAASPGLTPANFTTCIAFFGQVMGQVSAKAGLDAPIVKGPNAYKEINSQAKESLGSRWKPAVPGARPRPGDLLIFTFNEDEKRPDGTVKYGEGWFAHISILRATEPMEPDAAGPRERWISVDGGGTTAKETFRVFHPATGLIVGPGTTTRTMKGWIDIEAAVEAGLVPKP
jgi:hypothetical protein